MNVYFLKRVITVWAATVFLLELSGCGQFSYKRGATFSDLQHEKTDCTMGNKTDAEVQQCLKDRGWLMVDMDEDSPHNNTRLKTISTSYTKTANDPFAGDHPEQEAESTMPDDPYFPLKVSSWWKAGAGPKELQEDGLICSEKLGATHPHSDNLSQVTLGFAYCMQELGWRVLLQNDARD